MCRGFPEVRDQESFLPYCDEISEKQTVSGGCDLLHYMNKGKQNNLYSLWTARKHAFLCLSSKEEPQKCCHDRILMCLYGNHKKALNDPLLSGTSANASIHPSGCVCGQSRCGFAVQESVWVIQQNERPNSPKISLDRS